MKRRNYLASKNACLYCRWFFVWLFHHINMNETHDLWKAAYQQDIYKRRILSSILEIENAPEVLDAK